MRSPPATCGRWRARSTTRTPCAGPSPRALRRHGCPACISPRWHRPKTSTGTSKYGAPNSVTPRPEHHRMLRSAAVVSATVSFSRITGMVREMVMARLFGAGEIYDAFLLGMRIPNLTRNLFAEGALSSAFVPLFTQYLKNKGNREAQELSDLVATALLVMVGALCAVGM